MQSSVSQSSIFDEIYGVPSLSIPPFLRLAGNDPRGSIFCGVCQQGALIPIHLKMPCYSRKFAKLAHHTQALAAMLVAAW